MKRLLTTVFLLTLTSLANADTDSPNNVFMPANVLLTVFKQAIKPEDEWNEFDGIGYTLCVAYLSGITDLMITHGEDRSAIAACFPDNATRLQFASIVVDYLESTPESHKLSGSQIVVSAARKAYPCDGNADGS